MTRAASKIAPNTSPNVAVALGVAIGGAGNKGAGDARPRPRVVTRCPVPMLKRYVHSSGLVAIDEYHPKLGRKVAGGLRGLLHVARGRGLGGSLPVEGASGPGVESFGDGVAVGWASSRRSLPLGQYWRSSPLVFSLVPRCHGECGSQK